MSIDRSTQLKALNLYGMAAAWSEWQTEAVRRPAVPESWLDRLIEAEQADRQARSLRYQLKIARFPSIATYWASSGRKHPCSKPRSSH